MVLTISPGEQKFYITMINRLQTLFAGYKKAVPTSKTFLITAAPQCVVKDVNMGDMIIGAQFDMIFVQFYNTAACSARTWVTANPNYATTRREITSGFSYDSWVSAITASGSKSSAAKIYIGLPGNSTAVSTSSYYLSSAEVKPLVQSYWCHPNFGGLMIWEAMYAEKNTQGNFYQAAKSMLNGFATGTSSINCATVTTSKIPPTPTCGAGVCATTYTVKSGDICVNIASSHGLTMAQFTALNPKWTTATCPNLQIGTVLCVKAAAACPNAKRDGRKFRPSRLVDAILTLFKRLPWRHLCRPRVCHAGTLMLMFITMRKYTSTRCSNCSMIGYWSPNDLYLYVPMVNDPYMGFSVA
jgi:chitinase